MRRIEAGARTGRREGGDAIVYLLAMVNAAEVRRYGRVFNEIADEYDRHRPAYPDALINLACAAAGLAPGERVLEIGSGTGQLTRALFARGLSVTAIEPGEQLITRARGHLSSDREMEFVRGGEAEFVPGGEVEFVHARLEDAPLPSASYRAVFSASAIHWVDPDVSWRKLAEALVDGGTLALVSYFGVEDAHSREDQRAVRGSLARIAPKVAASWPGYRDLESVFAGVADRADNVSEAWSWLGSYELARPYAAALFTDVELSAIPSSLEHSASALNAVLATMSFWARLSPEQRDAVIAENHASQRRLGRPIRSSVAACLLTARRTARR